MVRLLFARPLGLVGNVVRKNLFLMNDTSINAQSQLAAIRQHLEQYGTIDLPTARQLYGCEALRSRIADLKNKQGLPIKKRMVAFVSMFGHRGR